MAVCRTAALLASPTWIKWPLQFELHEPTRLFRPELIYLSYIALKLGVPIRICTRILLLRREPPYLLDHENTKNGITVGTRTQIIALGELRTVRCATATLNSWFPLLVLPQAAALIWRTTVYKAVEDAGPPAGTLFITSYTSIGPHDYLTELT
jgi:hypothetical protein